MHTSREVWQTPDGDDVLMEVEEFHCNPCTRMGTPTMRRICRQIASAPAKEAAA